MSARVVVGAVVVQQLVPEVQLLMELIAAVVEVVVVEVAEV